MMKKIKVNWCNWPHRENKRGPDDLYKVGVRCDAWRSFLQSETIAKLKKIKGSVIWFNKYEYFDKLICEFDCSEKKLRSVIESLMRRGHEKPVEFLRRDIYDARAWAYLSLSCFAGIDGCNERSGKNHWQHEILKYNEIPVVQFGIKLPWVVSRSCFTLTHRLKNGERFAIMTFDHPQLDLRFDSKRWVGKETFPRETTRKEMTEHLFATVESECAKHLVAISD
jgi:hypothetical protein